MHKILILGATGSLGLQTLEVLKKHRKHFKVVALSANKNSELLLKLGKKYKVKKTILTSKAGQKSLLEFIQNSDANIVVNVLSGIAGIQPTITALKSGKIVLLGNKESLIAQGKKIMKLARQMSKRLKISHALIPLDSEHNAIFEILKYLEKNSLTPSGFKPKRIILPCSGGPFWQKTRDELNETTLEQALYHPKWKMGRKISIESATLLNKGFEIIEAYYLFDLPLSRIDVKIHPECKIHGIVEFKNKLFAYLGKPDMREHIENGLLRAINCNPPIREIRAIKSSEFSLIKSSTKTLTGIEIVLSNFKKKSQDMKKFLQKEEKVIAKFLDGKITFTEIFNNLDLPKN